MFERHANIRELLALAREFPRLKSEGTIYAFGSPTIIRGRTWNLRKKYAYVRIPALNLIGNDMPGIGLPGGRRIKRKR